jgi:hypothetical protein
MRGRINPVAVTRAGGFFIAISRLWLGYFTDTCDSTVHPYEKVRDKFMVRIRVKVKDRVRDKVRVRIRVKDRVRDRVGDKVRDKVEGSGN